MDIGHQSRILKEASDGADENVAHLSVECLQDSPIDCCQGRR
jgi:hypothetical protein